MENLIEIQGLCKHYKDFTLDHIDLTVPEGQIVGLIGENGAGKTTTLKALLGVIRPDGGTIRLLGGDPGDPAIRSQVGVVFEDSYFYGGLCARQIDRIMAGIHATWDSALFHGYCRRFDLEEGKPVKDFSRGMRMKMSLATALAHRPKLLVMDEATSGLDPVVRDDILDLFLEFVQEEDHAILVSSHITSDLEKVADYIVFLHQGRVVFCKPKDELRYRYGVLRCGQAQFADLDPADMVACRRQDYEWEVLVADRDAARRKYPKAVVDPATMDEIMLLYVKGERR